MHMFYCATKPPTVTNAFSKKEKKIPFSAQCIDSKVIGWKICCTAVLLHVKCVVAILTKWKIINIDTKPPFQTFVISPTLFFFLPQRKKNCPTFYTKFYNIPDLLCAITLINSLKFGVVFNLLHVEKIVFTTKILIAFGIFE